MLSPTMLSVIEEERIASIKELGADAMGPSPSLDRICELARHIFAVPIAYVSVLDGETQWLKAQCGVSMGDMPRGQALCDHTIGADDVLVIPDTLDDERFATNALVTGGAGIRFYAGAPLLLEPGIRLGALCVADTAPRAFRSDQAKILADLAEVAMAELIRHRADVRALADRDELARVAERTAERDEELLKQRTLLSQAESIGASGSWEVDLTTGGLTWSDGLYRLLGVEPDAGHDAASLFRRSVHPEDLYLLDEAIRGVEGARSFALEIRIVDAAGRTRQGWRPAGAKHRRRPAGRDRRRLQGRACVGCRGRSRRRSGRRWPGASRALPASRSRPRGTGTSMGLNSRVPCLSVAPGQREPGAQGGHSCREARVRDGAEGLHRSPGRLGFRLEGREPVQ